MDAERILRNLCFVFNLTTEKVSDLPKTILPGSAEPMRQINHQQKMQGNSISLCSLAERAEIPTVPRPTPGGHHI